MYDFLYLPYVSRPLYSQRHQQEETREIALALPFISVNRTLFLMLLFSSLEKHWQLTYKRLIALPLRWIVLPFLPLTLVPSRLTVILLFLFPESGLFFFMIDCPLNTYCPDFINPSNTPLKFVGNTRISS